MNKKVKVKEFDGRLIDGGKLIALDSVDRYLKLCDDGKYEEISDAEFFAEVEKVLC